MSGAREGSRRRGSPSSDRLEREMMVHNRAGSSTRYRAATMVCMDMDLLKRITIEPGKCGGKPCIRGKRIRVSDILDLLGAGASFDEILRDYAFLQREDILAAVTYAAR